MGKRGSPTFSPKTMEEARPISLDFARNNFGIQRSRNQPHSPLGPRSYLSSDQTQRYSLSQLQDLIKESKVRDEHQINERWSHSGHVREHAQLQEDGTDKRARRRAFSSAGAASVRKEESADTSDVPIPTTEREPFRSPLAERNSFNLGNVAAGSPSYLNDQTAPRHHQPHSENWRASSYQLHAAHDSYLLSQKASMASITSDVDSSGETLPEPRLNQPKSTSSLSTPSRHSPERVARLRRLQSRSALHVPASRDANSPGMDHSFTSGKFKVSPNQGSDGPFSSAMNEERRAPGGSKMVEDFLSSRKGRQASTKSVTPAFL